MGEVIWAVDFRHRRDRELREIEEKVVRALIKIIDEADTAPSEYCAPESDPA